MYPAGLDVAVMAAVEEVLADDENRGVAVVIGLDFATMPRGWADDVPNENFFSSIDNYPEPPDGAEPPMAHCVISALHAFAEQSKSVGISDFCVSVATRRGPGVSSTAFEQELAKEFVIVHLKRLDEPKEFEA